MIFGTVWTVGSLFKNLLMNTVIGVNMLKCLLNVIGCYIRDYKVMYNIKNK